MKKYSIFVIFLAFFSVKLFAQPLQENLPPAGDITMVQYDTLKETITNYDGAELVLAHPSVTQVSIEEEFIVCFIPTQTHEAYPGIACRRVGIENGDIIVQTSGWNANPENTEFQPWLALFNKQDQEIRAEIIESTRSSNE